MSSHQQLKKKRSSELTVVTPEPPRLDFTDLLQKALITFKEQSLIDEDEDEVTLEKINLSKAKANSVLDSIQNLINVSHLNEIIVAEKHKFKREEELAAMNPLLASFKMAALSSRKTLEYLIKQLEKAMEELEEIDDDDESVTGLGEEDSPKTLSANKVLMLQDAQTRVIDNLNKITAGLTRIIQLERFSGIRPWGNARGMNQLKNAEEKLLPSPSSDSESGKKKPRKLTKAEVTEEIDTDDEDEDDDY